MAATALHIKVTLRRGGKWVLLAAGAAGLDAWAPAAWDRLLRAMIILRPVKASCQADAIPVDSRG